MTSSPGATDGGKRSPLSCSLPGPTARTRPRCGFCLAVSGSRMPPAVFSSASSGSTTTRSSSGRTFRPLVSCTAGCRSRAMIAFPVLSESEEIPSPRAAARGLPGCLLHVHSHATHAAHTSHASHAAHPTHAAHAAAVMLVVDVLLVLLGDVGDQRLGG